MHMIPDEIVKFSEFAHLPLYSPTRLLNLENLLRAPNFVATVLKGKRSLYLWRFVKVSTDMAII
ncbi:MAG: hypothetical protein KME23_18380 [Goleter apudmare HA4340-LM2]|jgi:hypothetical protein|nr:hypothetical protein [Goleter apudmare HA4340-LM2]